MWWACLTFVGTNVWTKCEGQRFMFGVFLYYWLIFPEAENSWNPSFLILLIRIVSLTEKSCLNVLRVRIVKGLQTPCSFVMSAKDLNLNHHSWAMDILLQNVALTQDHCRFLKNILINIIVMIIIDWWLYLNVDMAYWSNRPSY